MPAKPLSPEQLEDAVRLKALFRLWQARRATKHEPWSQEHAADQLGIGQSAMNQYLNGRIPLNLPVAVRFARLLGVGIEEFSPAVARLQESVSKVVEKLSGPGPQAWPFPEIDPARIAALDPASLLRLEGAILMAASQLQLDIRKKFSPTAEIS